MHISEILSHLLNEFTTNTIFFYIVDMEMVI